MLTLDPKTTALVLIDLQAGLLAMPLAPHAGPSVVAAAARLGQRFAALGAPVVPVTIGFDQAYADKPNQPIDQPMLLPDGGLPPGWSTLDPAIAALPAAVRITKRQWSAFHGTELDLQLRRRGITTIVLGGIATNFGVESTAREAWQQNYAVVVAEDASTSLAADLHQMSVTRILPRCSRVRTTEEILAALPQAA